MSICEECRFVADTDLALMLCKECGNTDSQLVDTCITSFAHWTDFTQSYDRSKRFASLLEEINGLGKVPDEVIRWAVQNNWEKKTHKQVRKLLIKKGGVFQTNQHKVCSLLSSLGACKRQLNWQTIERATKVFTILDKRITEKFHKKVSFTLLLPIVLIIVGREDKLVCCKRISRLIKRKYFSFVLSALETCIHEFHEKEVGRRVTIVKIRDLCGRN